MGTSLVAVQLREVIDSDLPLFFEHQQDKVANHVAAFSATNPDDRAAFDAHWRRIRSDPAILMRTILADGAVVGYVAHFIQFGDPAVAYWLDRVVWGRGVATQALRLLLQEIPTRPLYGRAAKDNFASIRVMEKCGFVIIGQDSGYAEARGQEVDEVILRLDAD